MKLRPIAALVAAVLLCVASAAYAITTNFNITVTIASALTTVFDCSAGFGSPSSGACGVIDWNVGGSSPPFKIVGSVNGSGGFLSAPQVNLVPAGADHAAMNMNWSTAAVNVGQFSTTFTYVPNGYNAAFILSNCNTGNVACGTAAGGNFTAGASCEGAFFQGYNIGGNNPPNNTFALQLDQWGLLAATDPTFTYSSVQYYDTGNAPPNAPNPPGQNPCNPSAGGALQVPYVSVTKVSTSPVALNNPANTQGGQGGSIGWSGHTYSVTITYDGSNLTINMFDVTAGGSCPSATTCFTHTWTGVSISTIVGGSTAWVGLGGSTSGSQGNPLLINSWKMATN